MCSDLATRHWLQSYSRYPCRTTSGVRILEKRQLWWIVRGFSVSIHMEIFLFLADKSSGEGAKHSQVKGRENDNLPRSRCRDCCVQSLIVPQYTHNWYYMQFSRQIRLFESNWTFLKPNWNYSKQAWRLWNESEHLLDFCLRKTLYYSFSRIVWNALGDI